MTSRSTIGNLRESDLSAFARLGIPAHLLELAGIERVADQQARATYGLKGPGDMAGILYPYIDPVTGQRVTCRVRRDNPEMEDGKPKNKYVSAYGDRKHLFFPPGAEKLLQDHNVTIVFVEAEKAAISLLAWSERIGRTILPIAMGGCWGWRGRIGKSEAARGERVDEVGPLSDLNCASNGRKAIVLLDANVKINAKVQQAEKSLVRQLAKQGAEVATANLPAGDGINGPDDYIAICGDVAMANVLDAANGNKGGSDKEKQAECLLRLAGDAELFHNLDDVPFATIPVNDHTEHWPILSKKFGQWLRRRYYEETKSGPQSQVLQEVLSTLCARAHFDGQQHPVSIRVAGSLSDSTIYIDLVDEDWQVVEITAHGWRVVSEPPVRFRRSYGMRSLPIPTRGATIIDLKRFLNIKDDDDWHLVLVWILAALCPRGPYPVLIWGGEQGTCKSTASAVLRSLIDPNAAPLRTTPLDERDLFIAANSSWVIALDNLSGLPDWLSDGLCRLATGGGLATRQLYTDLDEIIIDAQRPIVLNGISELSTRGDLVDRSLVISLSEISAEKRRDEREFHEAFNKARPAIFGALLDVLSGVLAHLPHVKLSKKPRMADFALIGTAVERTLDWEPDTFMKAYEENRSGANATVIDSSIVALAVQAFVEAGRNFEGTAGEMLKELSKTADEALTRDRHWPRTPRGFSGALRRVAPSLRLAGLIVEFGEKSADRKRNRILRVCKRSSEPSEPSEDQHNQHFNRTIAGGADGTTRQLDGADVATVHNSPLKTMDMDGADGADGRLPLLQEATLENRVKGVL